ncbi:MAG: hypothetical protein WBG92_09165 [Thiohalocapsa sp.]
MQPTALALQRFAQPVQVGESILIVEEAGRTVVPPLNDMQREAVNVYACTSGHE